jgi:hypothetical protein
MNQKHTDEQQLTSETETSESKRALALTDARRWHIRLGHELETAFGISVGAARNFTRIARRVRNASATTHPTALELMHLVDCASWDGKDLWQGERVKSDSLCRFWEGSALDIERLLLASSVAEGVKRLLQSHGIDRLLGQLQRELPERVAPHRTSSQRRWRIFQKT